MGGFGRRSSAFVNSASNSDRGSKCSFYPITSPRRNQPWTSTAGAAPPYMCSLVASQRCRSLLNATNYAYSAVSRQIHRTPLTSISGLRYTSSSTLQRLSRFWIPTIGAERSKDAKDESHELLIRAGYMRQAHAGIFHMLPLGNRVQQKLEGLIDKHMESIGMKPQSAWHKIFSGQL